MKRLFIFLIIYVTFIGCQQDEANGVTSESQDFNAKTSSQTENAKSWYGSPWNYVVVTAYSSSVDGWKTYNNTLWKSKFSGDTYGRIITSFRKSLHFANYEDLSSIAKMVAQNDTQLTNEEKAQVILRANEIDHATKSTFIKLFEEWKKEIKTDPIMQLSSDTHDYANLPQFSKLKKMGKVIIPLIMEQLLNENHFYLLVLYDQLQDNTQLVIKYTYDDVQWLEGEQNRAKRTIRKWLNN